MKQLLPPKKLKEIKKQAKNFQIELDSDSDEKDNIKFKSY